MASTMCAPHQQQQRGKELSFHSDKSPGSQRGIVRRRTFPFLWFSAHTFPAPELVCGLVPLQAERAEPQVEEERGGFCQMETRTENPLLPRAPGKGSRLLLKACVGHRCREDPRALHCVTPGWPHAIFKALQCMPHPLFCFVILHHASHDTVLLCKPYSTGMIISPL